MNALQKARSNAKLNFGRAKKSLALAIDGEGVPVKTIERRFSELQKCWETVQTSHAAYAEEVLDKKDDQGNPNDANPEV